MTAAHASGLEAQADALAAGETSSVELVNAALDAIAASQPDLNAFRCVREEAARAEAAEADRRLAAGERRPLLGVPIAIKDDTDVAGESTAFGCEGEFEPKTEDAEAVRCLREAGAVIVGKTNTPEFGQWPFTEGPAFGATRNPWDLERTPGGSSGGAASAVAAGLVPAALGSDGGGSVRIPAAWTGLVGIKPQRGRISTWPDPEAFNGLTCLGPLARSVADAALLLDAARGNRPGDLHCPATPDEPYQATARRRDPGRLRIALSFKVPWCTVRAQVDPEIKRATERIAGVLEGLGHEIVEADPRYGLIGLTYVPRGTAGLRDWAERVPDPGLLDRRTQEAVRTGRVLGGPLLKLAKATEGRLQRQVGSIFAKADLVLTPTTATPAPPIGATDGFSGFKTDRTMLSWVPFAWPWNVLGWPGISVPAGLTGKGLPVGAQFLGPAASESRLIALAAQLEEVERWDELRPPYTADATAGAQAA